jgi:HPr kinase/phosphorylase
MEISGSSILIGEVRRPGMTNNTAEQKSIPVQALLDEGVPGIEASLLAGRGGLTNLVTDSRIQKPGLSFAGKRDYIRKGRVQILARSESEFLQTLEQGEGWEETLRQVFSEEITVFVLTHRSRACDLFLRLADEHNVPVIKSRLVSSVCIRRLTDFLEDRLAPTAQIHGVLLEIFGLGVLLAGESGIGKSESALDLISRGHRLIADDIILIKRRPDSVLEGTSPEPLRHLMEVRGMGVINIEELFGVTSVRRSKTVELMVSLDKWKTGQAYDRLGVEEFHREIMGVDIPVLLMPVAPGRNISNLIEVGVRNHLLKLKGVNRARELVDRLDENLLRRGRRS